MHQKYPYTNWIVRVIICSTILFAMALTFMGVLMYKVPAMRIEKIESALAQKDTGTAMKLVKKLNDSELAENYRKQCMYLDAETMFANGEWKNAATAYAVLGNFENSAAQAKVATYNHANELAEAGEWEAALEEFQKVAGYEDAMERYDECRYHYAGSLADSGKVYEAFDIYSSMKGYEDATDRMIALAIAETGIADAEQALNAFLDLSPAEVERRAALANYRNALPRNIVDVGFYHTVAVKHDGSVMACGDNEYNQCDTNEWQNITQVAAGAYHTVGLKEDGTVVAVGRNTEAQCDVTTWTNIVQIAASDYATFGLKQDGSVVYTGYHADYYRDVTGWSNVRHISGGSYGLVALRNDGSVLATHESGRLNDNCVEVATNTGFSIGLKEDGTVVCDHVELEWENVVSISCSGTGIIGLNKDGEVYAHYFRPLDTPDMSAVNHAIAVACGGTHVAWIEEDGTVHVAGDTEKGQGDTNGWNIY